MSVRMICVRAPVCACQGLRASMAVSQVFPV